MSSGVGMAVVTRAALSLLPTMSIRASSVAVSGYEVALSVETVEMSTRNSHDVPISFVTVAVPAPAVSEAAASAPSVMPVRVSELPPSVTL